MFHALDLGADAILTLAIDPATGAMTETGRLHSEMGSGPRHAVWHPKQQVLYVLHEMGSFLASYSVDAATGALTEIQRVSTQPGETVFSGYSKAAEINVTPDGKFVIASNRGYGPDSGGVTIFRVDPSDGTLGHGTAQQVGDKFPRGMNLSPAAGGRTLLVAGQEGSTMTKFIVDDDGTLKAQGDPVPGPSHPTTVVFV
jgi:6-phosphogluconolactonase